MSADNAAALRPKLEEARKALDAALEEACEANVATANTEELIHLEESLAVARQAARNAIAALQRFKGEEREADESQPRMHRLFVDDRGVHWDAFCVYPSAREGSRALPSEFREGWLSIQCDREIRRLTPIPPAWTELSRAEMCELLRTATVAPRRTRSEKTKPQNPQTSI